MDNIPSYYQKHKIESFVSFGSCVLKNNQSEVFEALHDFYETDMNLHFN